MYVPEGLRAGRGADGDDPGRLQTRLARRPAAPPLIRLPAALDAELGDGEAHDALEALDFGRLEGVLARRASSARCMASSAAFSSIFSSSMALSARTETLSRSIWAKPPPTTSAWVWPPFVTRSSPASTWVRSGNVAGEDADLARRGSG